MCRTKQTLGRDEAAGWPRARSSTASVQRTALFEGSDGAEAFAVSQVLGRMNVDTMWCPGPGGGNGPRCPLAEGGRCRLVEEADFVINNLGTDSPSCLAVALAVDDSVREETPVVIVTRRGDAEEVAKRLARCQVVEGPITRRIVTDVAQSA